MSETLRLYAFNCGTIQASTTLFIPWDPPRFIHIPVPAYLIEHPKGLVLFDSGLGERFLAEAGAAFPAETFVVRWHAGQDIARMLEASGFDPARIDWIVNSHFHYDHCGGNARLPNATVIVQQRELDAARAEEQAGERPVYFWPDFETGQPVRAINGEFDLFGDGAVRIVPTTGHTAGHQSIILRLPAGETILCGDCCYTERNLLERALPGRTHDAGAALATLDWLTQRRARGARLMFGHDPAQWAGLADGTRIR